MWLTRDENYCRLIINDVIESVLRLNRNKYKCKEAVLQCRLCFRQVSDLLPANQFSRFQYEKCCFLVVSFKAR